MKIEIEATSDVVDIDGVSCRRWKGVTGRGVPCEVFVHRMAVHGEHDNMEFESELREVMPPANPAVPVHQVLGT